MMVRVESRPRDIDAVPAPIFLPPACDELRTGEAQLRSNATDVARLCERCPLVEGCLRHGLEYEAAYRAGTDRYGAFGVWGGYWFEPGKNPQRLLRVAA